MNDFKQKLLLLLLLTCGQQLFGMERRIPLDCVTVIQGYIAEQHDRLQSRMVSEEWDLAVLKYYRLEDEEAEPLLVSYKALLNDKFVNFFKFNNFIKLDIVGHENITNKDFLLLCKNLSRLTGLRSLSVDFEDCGGITNDGFQKFTTVLAGLTGLRQL